METTGKLNSQSKLYIIMIGGDSVELSERQKRIVEIVKENSPITGENIASRLDLTRATLRPDLANLTMAGFIDGRPRVGYFYTGKTGSDIVTKRLEATYTKIINPSG